MNWKTFLDLLSDIAGLVVDVIDSLLGGDSDDD